MNHLWTPRYFASQKRRAQSRPLQISCYLARCAEKGADIASSQQADHAPWEDITTQNAIKPDAGMFTDLHVANDVGAIGNESCIRDIRLDPFKCS